MSRTAPGAQHALCAGRCSLGLGSLAGKMRLGRDGAREGRLHAVSSGGELSPAPRRAPAPWGRSGPDGQHHTRHGHAPRPHPRRRPGLHGACARVCVRLTHVRVSAGMCACKHVGRCVCIRVCRCTPVCTCIRMCVERCAYVYECARVCVVCMRTRDYARVCACAHVCMRVQAEGAEGAYLVLC